MRADKQICANGLSRKEGDQLSPGNVALYFIFQTWDDEHKPKVQMQYNTVWILENRTEVKVR